MKISLIRKRKSEIKTYQGGWQKFLASEHESVQDRGRIERLTVENGRVRAAGVVGIFNRAGRDARCAAVPVFADALVVVCSRKS